MTMKNTNLRTHSSDAFMSMMIRNLDAHSNCEDHKFNC